MITWEEFEKIELRVGTIIEVDVFKRANKPSYKLVIDFGEFGIKQSSAQVTDLYKIEKLPGKQVVCVLNFPSKNIAGFQSEVLTTGFANDKEQIVLISPDHKVPNGSKLF